MATEKQKQAARENGKKSRGPVSPDGKAASSQNAVSHGLCSTKWLVQNNEDRAMLDASIEDFTTEYQPAGPTEAALVRDIAHAHYCLERIWAIQVAALDFQVDQMHPQVDQQFPDIDEPTRDFLAFSQLAKDGPGLALLNRYQVSYDRAFHRARKALLETQAARRQREIEKRKEELLLAEEIAAQSGPRSSDSLAARIQDFQTNRPSAIPPEIIDLPRTRPSAPERKDTPDAVRPRDPVETPTSLRG
jgi:hypothetical protein